MKTLYKLTLSFFAVLAFISCGEDDDSFKEPIITPVTVSDYIIFKNNSNNYIKYASVATAARLNLNNLDSFGLGSPASASFVDNYINNINTDRSISLSDLAVKSSDNKNIKDVLTENLLKTENVKLELDRYFENLRSEINRVESTGVKFDDITKEQLINLVPISFENEDFFNVLDLLNSTANEFTVLIPDNLETTIDNPDKTAGGTVERNSEQLRELLFSNIFEGKFSTDKLAESIENLNGDSISVTKTENEENIKKPIYKLNDEITIDPVFRNLDAKSNGFIHQVDKLIVPVEPAP